MRTRAGSTVAALALLMTCFWTAAGHANSGLEAEPQSIRGTVSAATFSSAEVNVICAFTVTGSLHRSIAKTRGTLGGFITEGRTSSCRNSLGTSTSVTFLLLPWHFTYASFTGTLPRIQAVLFNLGRVSVLMRVGGVFGGSIGCLFQGAIGLDANGIADPEDLVVSTLTTLRGSIALATELEREVFGGCPASTELTAALTVRPLVRFILNGWELTPGGATASPSPLLIEARSRALIIGNAEGRAIRIRQIRLEQVEGEIALTEEERCRQWQPMGFNCTLTPNVRRGPASGRITILYGLAERIEVNYEG